MPAFDFVKETPLNKQSFRVAEICSTFDFTKNIVKEEFRGEIEYPDNWSIGLIVGKSGTGKSVIANNLYPGGICNFKYKENHVIDDFNKKISTDEITKMFSSVGFSSAPSWLKPYKVLSNGEKMRVDLARALLSEKNTVVFDEYTSVVDREIAQIGSFATEKAVRATNKKFIAVSCHFDIIEWLQPDWIYSTDEMRMLPRGALRPKLKIEIREEKGHWDLFKRYHYLNHSLACNAKQYVGFYKNNPVAFCAVINYPNPVIQLMKMVHRIVVLPDYQGIGIGQKLLNAVADIYYSQQLYFGIVTSMRSFALSLLKGKKWKLKGMKKSTLQQKKSLNKVSALNRNAFRLQYIGDSKERE